MPNQNIEQQISSAVLAYYWGEPWVSKGEYPKWNTLEPDQKEELLALETLVSEAELAAIRQDRLANAEFWKDKIDRMFDGEIATYEQLKQTPPTPTGDEQGAECVMCGERLDVDGIVPASAYKHKCKTAPTSVNREKN